MGADQADRFFALLMVAAVVAPAAVLKGVVVDNQTGKPLARSRVTIESVGRTPSVSNPAILADSSGQFTFNVAAGAYLLSAQRPAYLRGRFGQQRWNLPGTPIVLEAEGQFLAVIRLDRAAAVNGEVVDENGVGLPGQTVQAWKAGRLLKLTAAAETDDRGVYRIAGLEPGRYYVRTAARELEDRQGLLPTFHGQTTRAASARVIELGPGQDLAGVRIEPIRGRLANLEVAVAAGVPARVTLFTDSGRREMAAQPGVPVVFEQLAPGDYELLAEAAGGEPMSAYRKLALGSQSESVTLQLVPAPELALRCADQQGQTARMQGASIFVRRLDSSPEADTRRVSCGESLKVTPGVWELAAAAPPEYYVAAVRGATPGGVSYQVNVAGQGRYDVTLAFSGKPAALKGRVNTEDGLPAVGAPVFLQGLDPDLRSRLGGTRTVRSNEQGEYQFTGLPPGNYELLSSFAIQDPGEAEWKAGGGESVALEEGKEGQKDLELASEVR